MWLFTTVPDKNQFWVGGPSYYEGRELFRSEKLIILCTSPEALLILRGLCTYEESLPHDEGIGGEDKKDNYAKQL